MFAKLIRPKSDTSWPEGKVFSQTKSVLLEVGYIEKWPKFAYLKSKVLHLKFRVMRDRVYLGIMYQSMVILNSTGPASGTEIFIFRSL